MGTGKKEANRKIRQGKTGDGMANVKVKGENFFRDAKKLKVLSMYKEGKAQRNADGKIIKAASYQSREIPNARIEPNRKWFNNTRVISQDSLNAFRKAMEEKASDPYQVLLKSNKLPMSLIRDGQDTTTSINGIKQYQAKMTVETVPFSDTFGPKAQRKRVKIDASNLADLANHAEKSMGTYKDRLEQARLLSGNAEGDIEKNVEYGDRDESHVSIAKEPIFNKGQSKRIWNELYRVLDSSDVVIHVLDARDPLGTRCTSVEKYLKEEAPHKHLIFVLNKTDLVPTSVAAAWVRRLSKERPTLAFHSSLTNPFGKGSLIELLRQYAKLHSDRKQISVGLIGYPNVGKSSIVNTLRKKKVCTTAPIPGETKVWQYITLTKRLYLIDCPGIVPPASADTPQDLLLRGVVRVENVEYPSQYIAGVFQKVKKHHLERTYELTGWENEIQFLEMLARRSGRLLKKGEPDIDGIAKMVLNDMMRGKLPWYTPPPKENEDAVTGIEGRGGRLGEMPQKRKRDDAESLADTSMGPSTPKEGLPIDEEQAREDEEEAEFEGFESGDDQANAKTRKRQTAALSDDGSEDMIPLEMSEDEEVDEDDDGSDETSDEENAGDGATLDSDESSGDDDLDEKLESLKQGNPSKRRRRT